MKQPWKKHGQMSVAGVCKTPPWVRLWHRETPAPVKRHHLTAATALMGHGSLLGNVNSFNSGLSDRQENKLSQLHPFPGEKGWRVMWLFSPESVLFTNTFLCCSISIPYKQLLEMQIYFSKCNCVLQTTQVLLTMTNASWQGSQGQQLLEVNVFVAFPLEKKYRGWKIMHKVFLTLPKTLICHCYLQEKQIHTEEKPPTWDSLYKKVMSTL